MTELTVLVFLYMYVYCAQVLRAGELCEYGEPYELLSDPNSYLLRLVEHTGPAAAERLINMAHSAHAERNGLY